MQDRMVTALKIFPQGLAGIIFDCDGVMIDSLEANREFYNILLSSLGLPPMTPEQEEYAFMATAKQALLNMIPAHYHDRIEDIIKNNINYDRDVLPKIRLMPGFLLFIQKCHERGIKLAIDTNRTDFGIYRVLEFFSLPPWFAPVITSSNSTPKPSGEGVEKICRDWKVVSSRVLFVGDSLDDRTAAEKGGAKFAAFGGKGLRGELEAKNFSELAKSLFGKSDG